MTTNYIGKPESRVDGRLKVTGAAKYAAEFNAPDLAYGYVVLSEVAKGKITLINTAQAEAISGVVKVFTHENRPRTAWFDSSYKDEVAPPGSPFRPLYDENILYNMQPIALVVAEDFETARYAATLVEVEYETEPHQTDLNEMREDAYVPKKRSGIPAPPSPRGDAEKAFDNAAFKFEAEYSQPPEHHNPMEMHASTVIYETDGKLTIYDKTQGTQNSQGYVCGIFGLSTDDVRVMSPFVGGGFGSGLRPQYQLFLATMAALDLKRSVRLTLTRDQMFTFAHRPTTIQNLSLGAHDDGTLESIMHDAFAETSHFEDYSENVVNWSGLLYNCANVKLGYKVAQLDVYTPADMRAPGATTGLWAFESAIDEIAEKVGMDPLEFRLKNYAYDDQNKNLPFSSKELKACYEQGAEKFGWSKRKKEPRSMRDGKELVGWGMTTGVWESQQNKASAKAELTAGGKLTVGTATNDIGTGTYTALSQIAAEYLGVKLENVTCNLGDSSLPQSPVEGGSWTVSSNGSAIKKACEAVGEKLLEFAQKRENSPFADAEIKDVEFTNGKIKLKNGSAEFDFLELMKENDCEKIEQEVTAKPDSGEQKKYTTNTHSACFVEVKVDEELGNIHVTRIVTAIAGGKIINPKTARSQILGANVWGISMALEEETVFDHKFGRFVNHNLAEYHVAVNADVPEIEVIFVEEHDDIVNPLGAKGLGEIGIVGVAAAIANAIYHATGKRVRDLPITLDKLL